MFDSRHISLLICAALLAGALTVAAGCGDDPKPETSPFEGTYTVIQHTRNNDGCETEGPTFDHGDKYFRLSLAEDGDMLAYTSCDDVDDCADSVSDTASFNERDGEHWKRVSVDIFDVRDACTVELIERIALFETDDDVRIESRTFEGTAARENNDIPCDEAFAREHQDELDCVRFESILAVPVE